MNRKQLAKVGLKWDPFSTEIPNEALYVSPKIESFNWRLENSLIREGGFGRIKGESGAGKSSASAVRRISQSPLSLVRYLRSNLATSASLSRNVSKARSSTTNL